MERKPIFIQRKSIFIERKPVELLYDEWLPVFWCEYVSGKKLHFINYQINYKGQIKRNSTDTIVKSYLSKEKEVVILYLDGYAYCINLGDIIQSSLLKQIYGR